MRIYVSGGDARFRGLAEKLGQPAECAGEAQAAVFGDAQSLEGEAGAVPAGAPVIAFLPRPAALERPVVNLLEDEAFLAENARLTAEGAIVAAARRAPFAIGGADCLVVGYGRIGRALSELLVGFHAHATVFARREKARLMAMARGARAVSNIEEGISAARIVFSTPPEMVIDERALARARADALIVDLASPPFGVDIEAAGRRGIAAWREGGVPGRYCPESAAEAVRKAVARILQREGSALL